MTSARRPVLAIAFAVWFLDLVSKQWALTALADQRPRRIIGDVLQLWLTSNPGAAFSMGTGSTWIFTAFASGIAAVVIAKANVLRNGWWILGFGGLLGGALGNLTDRLFRAPGFPQGQVVDFIALPNFPVFNVADSFITCSVVLMFWLSFKSVAWDADDE